VDGVAFYHFILGRKKAGDLFSDFLLGVPLCGRWVLSCKSSGQVDPLFCSQAGFASVSKTTY